MNSSNSNTERHLIFSLLCGCLALCALLMWALPARAQLPALPAIDAQADIRMPSDFSRVEFYLITVEVGDNVWDNFGHTALRMVDENSGTDLMFNWGLFDTSAGVLRFGADFAAGIMEYRLGVSPPHWELARYQAEQRSIWQDRLVLTAPQKQRLYQRLAWNLRAENLQYDYDYFFDNCTTRVRDYLDEALGGSLVERSRAASPATFRDEVQSHYASLPLIAFSLDVLMNERIDRRMSQWERMFLPAQLRNQLGNLGLLADREVLAQFPPPSAGLNPYYVVLALLAPLLLLLLSVRRASIAAFSSQPGFTLRWPGLNYRLLGLLGLVVSLFSGVYGLLMTMGWLFSAHLDLHGNINLLLFWPTDLLGLYVSLKWLLGGQAPAVGYLRRRLMLLYLVLHILAALVYVLLGVTGLTAQSTGALMLYAVPVVILFALVVAAAGLRSVRAMRFR